MSEYVIPPRVSAKAMKESFAVRRKGEANAQSGGLMARAQVKRSNPSVAQAMYPNLQSSMQPTKGK